MVTVPVWSGSSVERQRPEPPPSNGVAAATDKAGRRQRFAEPSPADIAERYAVLEQAPVFYTLPERTLRALARRMRPVDLAGGETALRQGEETSSLSFVRSGHCQIRLERAGRSSVAVALLSTGDFFGELAVLDEVPAGATAVALGDCRLFAIDRTALYSVLSPGSEPLVQVAQLGAQRAEGYAGIAAQLGWGRRPGDSRVVAVYSPKGGSGRTTLALNVAGELAKRYPGQVLLLDLSFPFTQAALLANLVPLSSLARMAEAAPEAAEEVLLSAVLFHPGSLMILPGCIRPEEADLVTPSVIARAIEIAQRTFRYVIVDLGVALADSTLAVFDRSDHILLVAPPELPAVKAAQDSYAIFTKVLGFSPERVSLVLNSRTPRPAVKGGAFERRVRIPVAVEIGYDGSKPDDAALKGIILSLSERSSEIARGARNVAELLEAASEAGEKEPDSEGRGSR